MGTRTSWAGFLAVAALFVVSCGLSGGGNGSNRPFVPAPSVPIISNGTVTQGAPPVESPTGPVIQKMDSLPALDIAEAGGVFSLLMTYDAGAFPLLTGAVLYLEGDSQYFLLPVTELPGGLAVISFTINDNYPQGSYTLNLAILGANGKAGKYVSVILHIAQVPSLDILGLYPLPAAPNPENRVYEPLNTVGRAVFSKAVTTPEFTLKIQDVGGALVPAILRVLPGNKIASLIPTQLLQPDSRYTVTATLPGEGIQVSNPFFTEITTPLGASSANAVGKVFSFALDETNVVEPEAATVVFGLLGAALPPFLMVISDIDIAAGSFSAYGGLSADDPGYLVQDFRAPVLEFANSAPFQDPYFFAGPSTITMKANIGGFALNVIFHDFTMSGSLNADGSGFTNGAVSLYLDPNELAQLVEDIIGQPIDDLCADLVDIVGIEVCDSSGKIVARAEGVVGTLEPAIPALYDIVPDLPAPNTISAAAGDTVNISGTLTENGGPAGAGYNIDITSTVGTPSPSTAVTLSDGTFSATLTVAPGEAAAGTDIVVTLDAVDISAGAPNPLQRTISIGANP